jgi:4-amino-4-deoxy-L-arabinose transferase-like glycosyltransferase
MRRAVVAVLLLAWLLRLGWALGQGHQVDRRLPDQLEYLELAQNLRNGQGLSFVDPRFGQAIKAYRMPGYPALLAALGNNILLIRIVQATIDTGSVLAAYLLARRWLGPGPSLAAAAAVAVNPFLVYFSSLLLSETLYVSVVSWALVLLVRPPGGTGVLPRWFWGIGLLALGILVRPGSVALPLLAGIMVAWSGRRDVAPGRHFPAWSGALLLTGLVLLPWAWRNQRVLGHWVWLTTNGGATLYDGFNPQATGASDQRFFQNPQLASLKNMSEYQRHRELLRRARQWITHAARHDPHLLLSLTLAKIARTWTPMPLSADYGGRALYRWAAATYSIPLCLLFVAGLGLGRLPRPAKLLLALPAAYLTLAHALSVGSLRYRLPAETPMAVVAASMLVGRAASAKSIRDCP